MINPINIPLIEQCWINVKWICLKKEREKPKTQMIFSCETGFTKSYLPIIRFGNQSLRPLTLISIILKCSHVQPVAHERWLFDSQHSWVPVFQTAGLHEFKSTFYLRKWKPWGRGGRRSMLMMTHVDGHWRGSILMGNPIVVVPAVKIDLEYRQSNSAKSESQTILQWMLQFYLL